MGAYHCLWYQYIIKEKKKRETICFGEIRAYTFGHGITEENLGKNNFLLE